MRILIFGAKGFIGSQFLKVTQHEVVIAQTRPENYAECFSEIQTVAPDSVVSFIGRTYGRDPQGKLIPTIDYLELPGKLKENLRDNLTAPFNLAHICECLGIHFLYLGTGCIYTYTADKRIFTEEDYPNFTGSSYSTVKGQTNEILKHFKNTLQLRIRMPIFCCRSSRNFIDKIVSYPNICSIPNSMSVMDDMWAIMDKMIEVKETGVYNLTNPGTITHDWILNKYKELINPSHTWNLVSYEDQMKFIKSDRSNNELDTTKLETFCTKHGLSIPEIHKSVLTCLKPELF